MSSVEPTAATASLSSGGLRRVLVVLCVTEIASWGVLYYAFPVLAPAIAADTGWSVSMIIAGFSTGLADTPTGRTRRWPAGRRRTSYPRWPATQAEPSPDE